MTADAAPKSRWFRRHRSPGGLIVGNDVVNIAYGDPVDETMNDNDAINYRSYHVSPTGQIISGDNLVKTENWDAANNTAMNAQGKNSQSYGKLREEGDEHFDQLKKQKNVGPYYPDTSGFTFVMKEKDCLDVTFDGIEGYGCQEGAGDVFPSGVVPPLSSEASYELQKTLDGRLMSCDANLGMEEKVESDILADDTISYGCSDTSAGEIFPDGVSHLSPTTKEELQKTLDGEFLTCGATEMQETRSSSDPLPTGCCTNNKPGEGFGFMASVIVGRLLGQEKGSPNVTSDDPSDNGVNEDRDLNADLYARRINRENSIIDVESFEESRQNRLEQLRRNKRAIEERQRLGYGKNQTIVIPRNDLYDTKGESDVSEFVEIPISELQVGAPVTEKQTKKFFLRRKLLFIGTLLLISIGVAVLAVALFLPTREL